MCKSDYCIGLCLVWCMEYGLVAFAEATGRDAEMAQ